MLQGFFLEKDHFFYRGNSPAHEGIPLEPGLVVDSHNVEENPDDFNEEQGTVGGNLRESNGSTRFDIYDSSQTTSASFFTYHLNMEKSS